MSCFENERAEDGHERCCSGFAIGRYFQEVNHHGGPEGVSDQCRFTGPSAAEEKEGFFG